MAQSAETREAPPRRRLPVGEIAAAIVVTVAAAAIVVTAITGVVDWNDAGRAASLPLIAPVLAFVMLYRAGRAVRAARASERQAPVGPSDGTLDAPAAPRADVDEHARFYLEQRLRFVVNQYDVATLAADGRSADRRVCFVEQKRFALKEDLRAFTSEAKEHELFRIKARQVFDPAARYRVTDPDGRSIGELRKVFGESLLRSTWDAFDASGRLLLRAQERRLSVALWRRIVDFVPVVGELLSLVPVPYHFDFHREGECIGELRRIYGWRDRYALDVTGDQELAIDRRLAIALAVGLDALQAR